MTITFADKKVEKNKGDGFAFSPESGEVRQKQNENQAAKPEAVLADGGKRELSKDQDLARNGLGRVQIAPGIAGGRASGVASATPVAASAPAPAPTPIPAAPVAPPPAPARVAATAETRVAEAPPATQSEFGAEEKMRAQPKEAITVTGSAPSYAYDAVLESSTLAASPRAVFGLSIDPKAFDRVKHDIEKGTRPAAGSVDVSALVNYFAGSAQPPRRDVRLDVEASRSPIGAINTASLRFTIDTPREIAAAGVPLPPVATDAELAISLNSQVVESHRIIGATELTGQATLVKNLSVTGILDLKLKPGIPPHTMIATLTLRYRSVEDGKRRTTTRVVRASDVERTWASASRRHRLATLGAVWSETLNGGTTEIDLARTALRLATENRGDERAQDLADVASAFSRLRSF